MAWKVVIGALIIGFAVREIFQDLFHPSASGALSAWIGKRLFRMIRRSPSMLASAGPLAVVTVIFTWAFLLVIEFAFVYWAAFPANFQLDTANRPTGSDGFWWSLYYSFEMLTTLGLGDIRPIPNWLRILSSIHTLVGFSLVSAAITWIVLLFPALRRMRTLARKTRILADAEVETRVPVVSGGTHIILAGLAEEVAQVRVDLVHFPILFYFYTSEHAASLADAVFTLMRFAHQGSQADRDDLVRLSSTALRRALEDLSTKVAEHLSVEGSMEHIFRAFADLHLKRSGDDGNPA